MVSVLIPVYNMECLLPRCVESVINQTYSALDIILIDDGSTDNSGAICQHYSEKDDRITALHKPNSGVADAINMGLDKARGDFIIFLDSDDYFDSDMITKLVSAQSQTGADIVQTGMARVNESGDITYIESHEASTLGRTEQIIHEFFTGNRIMLCLGAKLFKRSLFDDFRLESGRNIVDILATPYLLNKSSVYVIIEGAGYNAYFREGSVSRGYLTEKTYDDNKYYLEKWLEFVETFYPDNEEYKAKIFYRGTYEMAYRYPLLTGSPYITEKRIKQKEMRELFMFYYSQLRKTSYYKKIGWKKKAAFLLFNISPLLMCISMSINAAWMKLKRR